MATPSGPKAAGDNRGYDARRANAVRDDADDEDIHIAVVHGINAPQQRQRPTMAALQLAAAAAAAVAAVLRLQLILSLIGAIARFCVPGTQQCRLAFTRGAKPARARRAAQRRGVGRRRARAAGPAVLPRVQP